jgi:hypothetical protein
MQQNMEQSFKDLFVLSLSNVGQNMTQIFVNMKLFTRFRSEDKEKLNLVEISKKLDEKEPSAYFKVKVDEKNKRVFEVSKQKFQLDKKDCDLITIAEHTHFYELKKIAKQNSNIKFANAVITNQIMESFATITMYANILMMKVQMGPVITNII